MKIVDFKREWKWGLFIFWLLVIGSYIPSLINQHRFFMDDEVLLRPIEQMNSILEYPPSFLLDIQPVRDLSYWIDTNLSKAIGFETYHLTNTLLYFGIVFVVTLITQTLFSTSFSFFVPIVLFGLHPLNTTTVSWISGRKHLLSVFFIMCSTYLFITYRKSRPKLCLSLTGLFYLCSILSHPINVLWPVWATAYSWAKDKQESFKKNAMLFCGLLIIGIFLIVVSLKYYDNIPGIAKRVSILPSLATFSVAPMAIGRYFFNIFLPFKLNLFYSLGSFTNFFGIGIFSLFLLALYRNKKNPDVLLWVLMGSLPLAIVTLLTLTSFVSDTYIMTSLFSFLVAIIYMLRPIEEKIMGKLKYSSVILAILSLSLAGHSIYRNHLWSDSEKVFSKNLKSEKTEFLVKLYTRILLKQDRVKEALPHMVWLYYYWGAENNDNELWNEFASDLYHAKVFQAADKVEIFERFPTKNHLPFFSYYRAMAQVKVGNFQVAHKIIKGVIPKIDLNESDNSKILAEAEQICQVIKEDSCAKFYLSYREKILPQSNAYSIYSERVKSLQNLD